MFLITDKLISIIIPNYNSEKTLKLCLDAIYLQDYPNFEVIIVDDLSSDNSLGIARTYPCKILKAQKNGGPGVARNIGTKFAKGNILFFVDSDVALRSNALSVARQKFNENSELGAVCGIYDKEVLIKDSLVEEYRVLQDYYWKKSTAGYVTTLDVSAGAIRKDVFFEMGGFNPKRRISEDMEFGQRIALRYKILSTPEIVGKHDCDDNLKKILKNFHNRAKARVDLFKKRKNRFFKGHITSNRAFGAVFAGVGFFSLTSIFLNNYFFLIPLLFLILFLLSDYGLYLFVLKEKNILFLFYFIFIHLLVNVAIFLGVARGYLGRVDTR